MNSPRIHPSFLKLEADIKSEYPELPQHRIEKELHRVLGLVNKVSDLKGMKVLDLGSGSLESTEAVHPNQRDYFEQVDPYRVIQFDPWYCRILKLAGAKPTAVDFGSNAEEDFDSIQADLTNPNALREINDGSFHAVNNNYFSVRRNEVDSVHIVSPALSKKFVLEARDEYLENCMTFLGWRLPFLKKGVPIPKGPIGRVWDFNDKLDEEVVRVLRPNGIYTHNRFRFKKEGGVLKPY